MSVKSPRERAARALCHLSGNPEGTSYNGEPMWMSYLEEVDTVLSAALDEADWQKMRGADQGRSFDEAAHLPAPRYRKRSFITRVD